ncbi:MAG: C4-dicarboxylate ABC transporter permease, partial [Bacillota bacterium]
MKKLQHAIDQGATFVSAVMCAAMMIILMINIVLRYTPGIGGFSWYMEGSQYLNVWSMLIVGIAISVTRTHLKVALVDELSMKAGPVFYKLHQGFVAL